MVKLVTEALNVTVAVAVSAAPEGEAAIVTVGAVV